MQYLTKENNTIILTPEVSRELANFEKLVEEIKAKEEAIKEQILKEMEENGIIKISTDELTITYVAQTYREDFNKKQLKEDNEELYNQYIRLTQVKASLRIKTK